MLVVCLLVAALTLQRCDTPSSTTRVTPKTIVLPPDTVFVDRIKAQVRYRTITRYDTVTNTEYEFDTVYTTSAFTASVDTVLGCSRIKVDFKYPELCFENMLFTSCPDTVTTHDTVTTVSHDDKRWEYAGYGFLGGFVLGIIAK